MQPEISWEAYRKLLKFRDGIDAAQSHEEKVKYAGEHSIFRKAPMDTYTISYAGNSSWGGVADYVDSVFTITDGHLMIEVNALPGKICVCFQQVFEDDKYLKAFLQVLEEEGVPYELEKMDSKKLPGVKLGNI